MSRRTAEAEKAIRLAWERERDLVKEGKGTRDWSKEQQQDILNPDKGKAYDSEGRALQGQHMKSVGEYPEYQGDPSNIQFLTREEHLDAHMGSWQNPTNWYYDPVTKEIVDFGLNPPTPCKVVELKEPVIKLSEKSNTEPYAKERAAQKPKSSVSNASSRSSHNKAPRFGIVGKAVGKVAGFAYKHRAEIKTGVKIAAGVAAGVVLDRATGGGSSSGGNGSDYDYSPSIGENSSNRLSPQEHIVPGHSQRYHTKDGIKTIAKDPYTRGGRNNG